jgi:CelD/BcsL family acetyltransferase involved in cellulose biosynthesis
MRSRVDRDLTMRADLIAVPDLRSSDVAAWRELGHKSVFPNPFKEPDFVLPAIRAWAADSVAILAVRDGSEWLAAMPVELVKTWYHARGRCLTAWRHEYCYLTDPLVAGADLEAPLALLIRRGLQETGSLGIEWIDADWPFITTLAAEARVVVLDSFERAVLRRPEAGDPGQNLSSRSRRSYRKRFRDLELAVGELHLRDVHLDRAAYTRFLDLEASGWKGASGTATAMACRPRHGAFFIELCERFEALGRLRLLSLESDTRSVAMISNLYAGEGEYGFKLAMDDEFASFSPGTHAMMAFMREFNAGDGVWSDSCASRDNATLNKLWSNRRRLQTVIATRRDLIGSVIHAKWRTAVAAKPIWRKLQEVRSGRKS